MSKQKIILPITGMTCASCSQLVEKALKRTDGVVDVNVSIASEKATIDFDSGKINQDDLIKVVKNAGFGVDLEEVEKHITI